MADETPPSRRVARITVVIAFVPLLLWAFFWTLVKEIAHAFWYAWNEVQVEFGEMARTWQLGFKKDGRRYDDWN